MKIVIATLNKFMSKQIKFQNKLNLNLLGENYSSSDIVHLIGAMSMLATALYVLSKYQTQQPVEIVILGVALAAYLFILVNDASQSLKLRQIDWFITVPLLVYAVSPQNETPFWLLSSLASLMLLFGFFTVLRKTAQQWTFLLLGFAAQIAFFVLLVLNWNTIPKWLIIFFVSWFFYGVVDFIEGPQDNFVYTFLDIFNKPVFIISLLANLP